MLWQQTAFLIPSLKVVLNLYRGAPDHYSYGAVRGPDAFLVETVDHFV